MIPILSVIIPTYDRPIMLDRAIRSALQACTDGDFEVVVVPNGPHDTWMAIRDAHCQDPRVRWHPIRRGHACVARNHGLANARGTYVRFLDDDDYLLPNAASQLEELITSGADVSTAPLMAIIPSKHRALQQPLPAADDFICVCLLSIAISNMTAGCIFRRSVIGHHAWREDVVLHDDYLWILGFAKKTAIRWIRHEAPVGAYVQHSGERLSSAKRTTENSRQLVAGILDLHAACAEHGLATADRTRAAAIALLTHAYSAFPSSPFYLSGVIRQAGNLAPLSIPAQPLFHRYPWLGKHLLLLQWLVLPARYLSRGLQRLARSH